MRRRSSTHPRRMHIARGPDGLPHGARTLDWAVTEAGTAQRNAERGTRVLQGRGPSERPEAWGLAQLSMVLRYAHLASDQLRPAVERLSGLNLGLGPAGAISRTA